MVTGGGLFIFLPGGIVIVSLEVDMYTKQCKYGGIKTVIKRENILGFLTIRLVSRWHIFLNFHLLTFQTQLSTAKPSDNNTMKLHQIFSYLRICFHQAAINFKKPNATAVL